MLCFDVILKEKGSQGAFYEVLDGTEHFMWVATNVYGDEFLPKTPYGLYTCNRGFHRIPTGEGFNTFEVMNVPGHTGILFVHPGNLPRKDSDGCFLCGTIGFLGEERAVIVSRDYFERFTKRMEGIDSFQINIKADNGLED